MVLKLIKEGDYVNGSFRSMSSKRHYKQVKYQISKISFYLSDNTSLIKIAIY